MHRSSLPLTRLRRPSLLFAMLLCCATLGGLLALLVAETPAKLKGPQASERQVTLVVSQLLRRNHLSKHPLDDEISRRCLKNYLESLDPLKFYFLQSDIDTFMQNADELDDMIKRGDIMFAFTVFDRFLQRIDQRIALVDELLTQQFDFTKDEYFITDPDSARYPANAEQAHQRWRRRIKHDLLYFKDSEKLEGEEARKKLRRRYHSFAKRRHQTDNDELLEMYLTAMTTGFDPHTTYMSPGTLDNFNIQMRLNLEGIGAALSVEDGYTVVKKVILGGAADKHGKLKLEDRIVSVDTAGNGELVEVLDMKLSNVVKLIRGKAGTVVRLGVIPGGVGEKQVYTITRAKIELKDSEARGKVIPTGQKGDGTPYKIGVINLPSFYMDMEGARRGLKDFKSTTRDVRKILDSFNQQGADVVVLDLRHNGGGSLTEAIHLTGLFINEGPVVQVKDSDGRVQHYDDLDRGMAWKGPLVVLTSKFSASASEILAGAIQDYRRGIIVGDTSTHGKGTVQSLLDVGSKLFRVPNPKNLGALKITMQQFYRPDGESTQKRGVLSDVVLPSLTDHMDVGESDLDYAIDFDRVDLATHAKYSLVDKTMLGELITRSAARTQQSEDFTKLEKRIQRYIEQKQRKSVPLNEQKFTALRAELKGDEEDKEDEKKSDDVSEEVFKKNFYNDEVLAITTDYLSLLKTHRIAVRN